MRNNTRDLIKWFRKRKAGRRLSIEEFELVLRKYLNIQRGASILVHASFGNLHTAFSPESAVVKLMELVGPEGNILMPYYPATSHVVYDRNFTFDVRHTRTRTGILSQVFGDSEGVKKSLHPIKSLAAWGKDRDWLIAEHHRARTPYDAHSPYYRLVEIPNSRAIGIGIKKNTFVHCCEDIIEGYPKHYTEEVFPVDCIDEEGNHLSVATPIHTDGRSGIGLCDYLRFTKCPGYEEFSYRNRVFYQAATSETLTHVQRMMELGITKETLERRLGVFSRVWSSIGRV